MFYSINLANLNRFQPFFHHKTTLNHLRTSVLYCVYGVYTVAPLRVVMVLYCIQCVILALSTLSVLTVV
jgi:hypothetical protein